MSFDVYLEIDTGAEEHTSVFWVNYTSNMDYAIRHSGIDMWAKSDDSMMTGDGLYILHGASAEHAIEPLEACIFQIERDAPMLREREPKNGWGHVDTLLRDFLRPILEACKKHPKTTIRVSC